MPPQLPPTKPLRDCPPWPTMQWVPPGVINRLDASVKRLRDQGRYAHRKDVVGILVLYCAPETATGLWETLHPHLLATAPLAGGRKAGQALMVRLPSPVSLRIDALIERAREFGVVYRQDLIGALAMKRSPRKSSELLNLFDRYQHALAEDAVIRGRPKRLVLRTTPPRPGRRSR